MSDRDSNTQRTFTAAWPTYAVFGTIFSVLLGLLLFAVNKKPTATGAQWIALELLVVGAFLFFWISRFKVEFDNERVRYRSLIGSKEVRVADIQAYSYGLAKRWWRDSFLPPVRIELYLRPGVQPERVVINAKVFSIEFNKCFTEFLKRHGILKKR